MSFRRHHKSLRSPRTWAGIINLRMYMSCAIASFFNSTPYIMWIFGHRRVSARASILFFKRAGPSVWGQSIHFACLSRDAPFYKERERERERDVHEFELNLPKSYHVELYVIWFGLTWLEERIPKIHVFYMRHRNRIIVLGSIVNIIEGIYVTF